MQELISGHESSLQALVQDHQERCEVLETQLTDMQEQHSKTEQALKETQQQLDQANEQATVAAAHLAQVDSLPLQYHNP